MVISACIDTSVLVSAIIFDGKPEEVIRLAASSEINFVTSPQILSELGKVLRDKFEWDEASIREILRELRDISILVVPRNNIKRLSYVPDNKILECAVEGNADYIVTGDKKHLLPIKEFRGIKIVTPSEFLERL